MARRRLKRRALERRCVERRRVERRRVERRRRARAEVRGWRRLLAGSASSSPATWPRTPL